MRPQVDDDLPERLDDIVAKETIVPPSHFTFQQKVEILCEMCETPQVQRMLNK